MPQTRRIAAWLAGQMTKEGHQVALLSGEMVVEQRAAVIERFREGKEKVLITTNVCARGKSNNICSLCYSLVASVYCVSVLLPKPI